MRLWNNISISPVGDYRICCYGNSDGENLLRDGKNIFNVQREKPSEIINSKRYLDIRNNLKNNIEPNMCKSCFDAERAGRTSPRLQYNLKWEKLTNTADNTIDIKNIKHLDLRLGNLCNLKCRMCNPQTSTQWVDEWNSVAIIIGKDTYSEEYKRKLKDNSWIWLEETWDNLHEILDNIEVISITGGEPTLASGHYKLYEYIFEKKLENNITLKIYTNLTNIPQTMLHCWKKFKKVILVASIDGYKDVNDYIRFPSRWDSIEKNINKYLLEDKIELHINTVVQMYNITKLNELLDWILEKNIFKEINLEILQDPEYLNIRVLPENLKKLTQTRLLKFVEHTKLLKNNNVCQISELLLDMNSMDLSQYLNKFFAFSSVLDNNRQQNILSIIPELESYRNIWVNYIKTSKKLYT
jgi:MoaA/NifB/PqqE/SkfB family radical SAM enzyme